VLVLPGEREPGEQARELVGEVVVEDSEDVGLSLSGTKIWRRSP